MVGIIVSFFEVVGLKLKLIMKQSLYILLLNASSRILGHMTSMICPKLVLMFFFMQATLFRYRYNYVSKTDKIQQQKKYKILSLFV